MSPRRTLRGLEIIQILRKIHAGGHVEHKGKHYAFPLTQMTETKLPDKSEYYRYQLMAYFLMIEQSGLRQNE